MEKKLKKRLKLSVWFLSCVFLFLLTILHLQSKKALTIQLLKTKNHARTNLVCIQTWVHYWLIFDIPNHYQTYLLYYDWWWLTYCTMTGGGWPTYYDWWWLTYLLWLVVAGAGRGRGRWRCCSGCWHCCCCSQCWSCLHSHCCCCYCYCCCCCCCWRCSLEFIKYHRSGENFKK